MLATPMARDLGLSVANVFAAFSVALLVSALLGPSAGRAIDRWGGKPVLMGSNLIFAAGLALIATARGPAWLFAGWALLGVGMGSGLYEAAFATLVRLYGHQSRNAIAGVTLFGGFASTVGWPLSSWLDVQVGWRGACWGWAALHLLLALPLNALLPKARPLVATPAPAPASPPARAGSTAAAPAAPPRTAGLRTSLLLSFVFAVTWFSSTAMAAHLPGLLAAAGATLASAVALGALVGPAQVGARLLEFGVLRRVHPLLSTRLAALLHPLGAAILGLAGLPAAALFVVLHAAGNGILTIAKGTLPLVLFGPTGYGERQGLLMVPARIAQALAPWLFGLCLERFGLAALWLTGGLGMLALLALFMLGSSATSPPRP